jgi:hypothetical protein
MKLLSTTKASFSGCDLRDSKEKRNKFILKVCEFLVWNLRIMNVWFSFKVYNRDFNGAQIL